MSAAESYKKLYAKSGETSLAKSMAQYASARERAATSKPGFLKKALGTVLKPVAPLFDILARPMQAVEAPIIHAVEDIKAGKGPGLRSLVDVPSALAGHQKEASGAALLTALGVPKGKSHWYTRLLRGAAGLGVDIAADPLTWAMPGVNVVGKEATEAGAELEKGLAKLAQGVDSAAKTGALHAETIGTARRITPVASEAHKQSLVNEFLKRETEAVANSPAAAGANAMAQATAHASAGGLITQSKLNKVGQQAVDDLIKQHIDDIAPKAEALVDEVLKPEIRLKTRFGAKQTPLEGTAARMYEAYKSSPLLKKLSPAAMFPGKSQEMYRLARHEGALGHEVIAKEIRNELGDLTHDEAKRISHAIEGGLTLDSRLEAKKQWVMDQLEIMHKDEVGAGVRKAAGEHADNYLPHEYNTYRQRIKSKDFREARKDVVEKTGHIPQDLSLEAAKLAGLNPEQDIRKILLKRYEQHARDMAMSKYENGMVAAYARKYDRPLQDATAYGLRELTGNDRTFANQILNKKFRSAGEHWYMPEAYVEAKNNMAKVLSQDNPEEIRGLIHTLNTLNNHFKFFKTALNPATQVRNVMGDAVVASWDGVRAPAYIKWLSRERARKMGGHAADWVMKDGTRITHDEMANLAEKWATSGFTHTELGVKESVKTGSPINVLKSAKKGITKVTEIREDIPRMAHFSDAFKKEFDHLAEKGVTGQKAIDRAAEAASRRVNKYHFDYSALTPLEKKIKRAVPFYTYQRKITPLLLETAFADPGRLNRLPKYQKMLAEMFKPKNEDEILPGTNYPEYMNPIQLGGSKTPWVMDFSGIPRDPAEILGVENSLGKTLSNQAAKLSPVMRIPLELAAGKEFFSGKPTGSLIDELKQNFLPSAKPIGQAKNKEILAAMGLPVGRLSEATQEAAVRRKTLPLQAIITKQNKALAAKNLAIRTSSRKAGKFYRVVDITDPQHGRTIKVFKTPAEAQRYAASLKGR